MDRTTADSFLGTKFGQRIKQDGYVVDWDWFPNHIIHHPSLRIIVLSQERVSYRKFDVPTSTA